MATKMRKRVKTWEYRVDTVAEWRSDNVAGRSVRPLLLSFALSLVMGTNPCRSIEFVNGDGSVSH